MTKPDQLKSAPLLRIKPVDGMAVTAEVWEEAHDFHRHQLRLHALLSHGSGIVTGLEVIANDPPDNAVYILPGIATDSDGQTIILTEPLSFDVGRSAGRLYLLLTYGESRPRPKNGVVEEGGALYVRAEFSVEASPRLPATPYVELARLWRPGREGAISNAREAATPGPNEIDLRFRREVGAPVKEAVSVAVLYADREVSPWHARGAGHLARYLRGPSGGCQRVWVDDDVPLTSDLSGYGLVYLVAQSNFQLTAEAMTQLHAYVKQGGVVLMESCRRGPAKGAPADTGFADLLASLALTPEPLLPPHRLFTEPNLFATPPVGYVSDDTPEVNLTGEGGVIVSTCDYGCLWQGEREGRLASREEIRSALEWGGNLVAHALDRRRAAQAGPRAGS